MICPDCNGEKEIIGLFPVYADHVPLIDRKPYVVFPCDRCQATGEVPEEMLQWIEEGKRLKAMRMEPYRSLREEAQRRGISGLELSRMELGKIKPVLENPQ